nr:DegT/DnrJ/EryC1/StrS family aminotransferase [Nitrospirota bacterium]
MVRSGLLAQGEKVAKFERALAKLTGQDEGVAVSSGTAALFLALKGLGIGPGDEVIFPSYVCTAPWHAVSQAGATPVLVDIDPETYHSLPGAVTRAITSKTKAVIVPHLFGRPADLSELEKSGIPLIEDCAQTLGASMGGRPVGSAGALTVCSFYATKLITTGEGGMVLGRAETRMARIRALRQYDEQDALESAFNYKMTDMQAALGLCQVTALPQFIKRRQAIATQYTAVLRDLKADPPAGIPRHDHVFYRYVVRLPQSVEPAIKAFATRGVICRRPLFKPIHSYLGLPGFPGTDLAWERSLSIPIYPSLVDSEVERIVDAMREVLA